MIGSFIVHVVRRSDGAEQVADFDFYEDPSWEAQTYWWTEGNFACDCNRSSVFEDESDECGDTRFRIYVTDRQSGAVLYDERAIG